MSAASDVSGPAVEPDGLRGSGSVSPDDQGSRTFGSDNFAGVHPEILAALGSANVGHQRPFGSDIHTVRFAEVLREHFGEQATGFPVFNGTGANVLALQSVLPRWGAIICAESAHINTDENGALERVAGLKLLTVPGEDGKITPESLDRHSRGRGSPHRAQALAVSISQSTELGTCYTSDEVRALADRAHELGMVLHVDGARLANAAASLDMPLRAITTDAGVDILSLGGTKNGTMFGEAVVVLAPGMESAREALPYLQKFNLQLASKMRFISAQLVALWEGSLWLRSARHANAMATKLAAGLRTIPGVTITRPVEANAVFALVDRASADRAKEQFQFAYWDPDAGEARMMCAFDTTEADVEALVGALRDDWYLVHGRDR